MGAVELLGGRAASTLSQFRPLSLSHTDNKFVSLVLNESLKQLAARHCHPMQFGFIEGRQLADAVLLLEASAVHGMRRSITSGTMYIDFTVACPSVLHRWIRQVMYDMVVPTPVIVAMIALSACTWVEIRFGCGEQARCRAAFAIDPALHYLDSVRRCPQDLLVAYADDLALFLMQFLRTLLAILAALTDVRRATGLALAARKMAIIPAWTTECRPRRT